MDNGSTVEKGAGLDAVLSGSVPRLVVASDNKAKRAEIVHLLQSASSLYTEDSVVTASELGAELPVEDGATFAENALLKARAVFKQTGIPALSDDSGLIVNILGGAPGILSARWAGRHGDDLANNRLLLQQLADLPDHLRKARFVTVCAYVFEQEGQQLEITETGEMTGTLIRQMRGDNGFGYDAIFVPDAYISTPFEGKTTAELEPEQKNAISHRSAAIRKIVPRILEIGQ